jgi:hypothetical protein
MSELVVVEPPANPERALIIRPQVLPSPATFEIERQMAWRLRNAHGFLPAHFLSGPDEVRAAKILAAIEYGRAVGIEPMIALQNTQVIDGKVGASALLIGALLRKAGYEIEDDTNEERSIVTLSRYGKVSGRGEFSMVDAQRAQLLKPNSGWAKYPRDMMYARALTQAARRGAQDAVLGMAYTAEELGAQVDEEALAGLGSLSSSPRGDDERMTPEPGAPEASEGNQTIPTAAAIQPAPPAPSEGAPATNGASETSPAAAPPAPPPTAGNVMPLSGPALSRRMGAGASIGPRPRRTNTVTIEPGQGAETPATAPEVAPAPVPPPDPTAGQQAAADLLEEPVLPTPEDEGRRVYLDTLRQSLREDTATLFRVNTILDNVKAGLEGKEQKPVPPATPTEASDAALARRIEGDWPGRTLANLGEVELSSLAQRFEASLAKKRELMKERGISEHENG